MATPACATSVCTTGREACPDGAWSEPRQLGAVADHIQSFRVVDGTIHATVSNEDDHQTYYETLTGATLKRHEIPKASGEVALRIGDDGKARVAYEADGALWYGTFTGSDLATKKIPGSDNGYGPVLVLGAANEPYLLWHRGYHGAGCTYPDPGPNDGTYFSTLVNNTWRSEHLSTREGAMSLTLDVETARVHALIDAPDGMTYTSRSGGESWAKKRLFDRHTSSAVIRLDPRTGALLVAYVTFEGDTTHVAVVTYGSKSLTGSVEPPFVTKAERVAGVRPERRDAMEAPPFVQADRFALVDTRLQA